MPATLLKPLYSVATSSTFYECYAHKFYIVRLFRTFRSESAVDQILASIYSGVATEATYFQHFYGDFTVFLISR